MTTTDNVNSKYKMSWYPSYMLREFLAPTTFIVVNGYQYYLGEWQTSRFPVKVFKIGMLSYCVFRVYEYGIKKKYQLN